jgi:hypothetical protein
MPYHRRILAEGMVVAAMAPGLAGCMTAMAVATLPERVWHVRENTWLFTSPETPESHLARCPHVARVRSEMVLREPRLDSIERIKVVTDADGFASSIIVAGKKGALTLGPELQGRGFVELRGPGTEDDPRATMIGVDDTGHYEVIDLDGDGACEFVERDGSLFRNSVAVFESTGALRFRAKLPFNPRGFGGVKWVAAADRSGTGRKEILVGGVNEDYVVVLDNRGVEVERMHWGRVLNDVNLVDLDGEGTRAAVYASDGALVVRSLRGDELLSYRMSRSITSVSSVRLDPQAGAGTVAQFLVHSIGWFDSASSTQMANLSCPRGVWRVELGSCFDGPTLIRRGGSAVRLWPDRAVTYLGFAGSGHVVLYSEGGQELVIGPLAWPPESGIAGPIIFGGPLAVCRVRGCPGEVVIAGMGDSVWVLADERGASPLGKR